MEGRGSQWWAHSSRLVTVKLQFGQSLLHVASCYAPTFAARREDKNRFFEGLWQYILSVDENEELIILGDFNARTGSGGDASNVWSHVNGPFGLGKVNDAGEELLAFFFRLWS